jgi:hypothetical protein
MRSVNRDKTVPSEKNHVAHLVILAGMWKNRKFDSSPLSVEQNPYEGPQTEVG